jgi:hypothetical protein
VGVKAEGAKTPLPGDVEGLVGTSCHDDGGGDADAVRSLPDPESGNAGTRGWNRNDGQAPPVWPSRCGRGGPRPAAIEARVGPLERRPLRNRFPARASARSDCSHRKVGSEYRVFDLRVCEWSVWWCLSKQSMNVLIAEGLYGI